MIPPRALSEVEVLGGLDVLALFVVSLLKGRWRHVLAGAGLIVVTVLALLFVNEPPEFADDWPNGVLVVVTWAPIAALYVVLITGAVRLAKPTSWWAQRFYDELKNAAAIHRHGGR